MSIFKRTVSAVLAVVMLAGMLPPLSARAEESETLPDVTEAIATELSATTSPLNETVMSAEDITLPAETVSVSAGEETQDLPEPTETLWAAIPASDGVLASGSCGEALSWAVDDTGTLTISGSGAMADYQSGYTPWESYRSEITTLVIEEGVTSIGSYAFAYLQALTDVCFPQTLTDIGPNTFQSCFALTDLVLPDNLVSIGKEAFRYSNRLRISRLPDNVNFLGEGAFAGTGLTAISLPASLTVIPKSAFYDCLKLETVSISAAGTAIGEKAFSNCSALTAVSVSGSISSIGNSVFYSCWNMTDIDLPEGLAEIGSNAFFNCTALTLNTLPDSLQSIGSEAFSGCYNLTLTKLPDSLIQLGEGAFEYCSKITVSALPAAITQIPANAFSGCSGMTALIIPEGVTTIGAQAFSGTGPEEITIPSSVTSIGESAFGYCDNLAAIHVAQGNSNYISEEGVLFNADKSILIQYPAQKTDADYVIPATVTALGPLAFYLCENIESIEIPGTISTIGSETFYNCQNLATVVLNEGTQTIEYGAFNYSGLTSIRIPASVTSMNAVIFEGCFDLHTIEVSEDNTVYASQDGVLMDKAKTKILTFPTAKESFVIPETVTELKYGCFSGANALTSMQIPGSIGTIPESAFSFCSNLTSVTLEEGIKVINNLAFSNCSSLTSISFPASLESIGTGVFSSCRNLKEIRFTGNAPAIADTAFGGSYPATYNPTAVVTYPADNATWTEAMFQNYGGTLTWVVEGAEVPVATGQCGRDLYWSLSESGVLSITGTGAMKNYSRSQDVPWYDYRSDIVEVILSEGATNVGQNAFYQHRALTQVSLPATVTAIGDYAFYYCEALTEITLPEAVTSIGKYAFYQCRMLETVSMGQNVDYIGNNAFNGIPWYNQQFENQEFVILSGVLLKYNGDSVVAEIPASVTVIGDHAFYDCTQLETVIIPEGVHTIGVQAFDQCSSLASVNLPASLTSIGNYAFRNCALNSVTFPEGLKTIGNYAFNNCAGLEEIRIPDSVTSLGSGAFLRCTGLKNIHIGSGLRALAYNLFEGCVNLTAIEIPYTITLIESYAFYGCRNLADIAFQEATSLLGGIEDDWDDPWADDVPTVPVYPDPGTALEIQWCAFGNCDALTEVYLPGHLSNLASTAFQGSDNTTHFYVSSPSYFSDNSGTIYGHTGGTADTLVCVPAKLSGEFVIPATVTEVLADFYGCSLLTSITFSAGAGGICSDTAFFGCTSLTEIIAGAGNDDGYYNDASGALLRNAYGSVYLCAIPADLTEYTVSADVTQIYSGSISNAPLTAIHVAPGNQYYSSRNGVLFNSSGTTLVKYPGSRTNTRYVVPAEVEQLGEYAFIRTENLTELWFIGDPFYVYTGAFDHSTSTLIAYYPQNLWGEDFVNEMGYVTDGTLHWKPYTLLTVGDDSVCTIEAECPLAVRTTKNINTLQNVQVDGKNLAASNYFTDETGNLVCFLPSYLGTLDNTSHTFRFQFTDGYEEISTHDEASAAMAEFEAMLAQAEETGRPAILNKAITLTKNLTLGNYQLQIRSGGHLTVPASITLTVTGQLEVSNGGMLEVEAGGTLVNQGRLNLAHPNEGSCIHVSGTYRADGSTVSVYADSMRIPEITGIPKSCQQLLINNTDTAALLWALEQQTLGYDQIRITIQHRDITLEDDITIGKNTWISVSPNYSDLTDTTLTLNGNTTLAGTLMIDSYAEYEISGIVQNNGTLTITRDGNLYNYGELLGNEPVVQGITQEEIELQLDEAAQTGEAVYLRVPLILERDLTVSCRLVVENGGQLTVPSGMTLTVNQYLEIQNGSTVEVKPGATLINNGSLYIGNSHLRVNGTYIPGERSTLCLYCPNTALPEVTGIDPKFQSLDFYRADEQILLYAATLQDQGYGHIAVSAQDLVLNTDVTIGPNMTLYVCASDNGTLPNMTNNGNLTLGGTLIVDRYSGESSRHYVQNNGSIFIKSSGNLNGQINGNDPVYLGLTQTELEQMLEQMADAQDPRDVDLESTLVLERDLTIPEGVGLRISRPSSIGFGHLVVPEGCTLTVNGSLYVSGKLDVDTGGTLVNNGELHTPDYSEDSRYIHINGSYVHGDGATVDMWTDLTGMPDVTGIEPRYIDLTIDPGNRETDESHLLDALALESRYHSITVYVWDLVLNSDVTVGENTKLLVPYNPNTDGVELTINGSLTVNGYMEILGSDPPHVGTVQNNGSLIINETGELLSVGYIRGNKPILNGGFYFGQPGGPVPNFRDFELRTESTTVDTCKTDSVLLSVYTTPLIHEPESPVFPDWTWTSSNHSIVDPSAIINNLDDTFTVPIKENALGTVTLTASFRDMPGVTASVTLTVCHLDSARKLTASADLPDIGLQPGQQAQMLVFGSDPESALDAEHLIFTSANTQIASVDDSGMITAGSKPGTVKITAAIANDPMKNRKATLSVKVISSQTQALVLTDSSGNILTGAEFDLAELKGNGCTFRLTPQPSYAEGITAPTLNTKSFKWTSSDTKLAAVEVNSDGSADVTVQPNAHGVCVIRAQSTDLAKITASFQLKVLDRSPRLGASVITLNPMAASGAEVALVSSYGNDILADSITLADDRLEAVYNSDLGVLILRAADVLANATINTTLTVPCQDGNSYPYALKVKVKSQAPAVTAKQVGKVDLFDTGSTASFTVTAKNAAVTNVALTDTEDFELFYDGETAIVALSDSYLAAPSAKPDTKATLLVWLDGYAQPVAKAVTIGTTTTKLSLTTDPVSSILNTKLSQDRSVCFHVINKKTKEVLPLTQDNVIRVTGDFVESFDVTDDGQIRLNLSGTVGGTAAITVQADHWVNPVQLNHTVSVSEALPTVKLAQTTLKLSSIFTQQAAASAVQVSHGNLSITGFSTDNRFVPTAAAGTAAYAESAKLEVYFDGNQVVAKILDPKNAPKNGNYTFTAVPMLEGTELNAVTVKINVSSKEPKVTFASTLKLNTQLAGSEVATAAVSLNNNTGYDLTVVDFLGMDTYEENVQLFFDEVSGEFSAMLLTDDAERYTYALTPVIRDALGRDVNLSGTVELTVQAKSSKISISHSASGKLDLVNPGSSIVYTVKKIANAIGTVADISLVDISGEETDLFLAEFDQPAQSLTLKLNPQNTYSTKETYKVKLRYSICGTEIDSSVLSIKVSQSKLKVTAGNCQYFQSQQLPMQVTLCANAPVGAQILAAEVNLEKTTDALIQAMGISGPLTFSFPEGNAEARMAIPVTAPEYLTAGKKYTLVLNVTAAGSSSPTEVRVTVAVNR